MRFSCATSSTCSRLTSTTWCCCRSFPMAAWSMPARCSCARMPCCSARRPRRPTGCAAPTPSFMRTRTSGSATLSPCAGSTICGSRKALPISPPPVQWRRCCRSSTRGTRCATQSWPPTAPTPRRARPPSTNRLPTWPTPSPPTGRSSIPRRRRCCASPKPIWAARCLSARCAAWCASMPTATWNGATWFAPSSAKAAAISPPGRRCGSTGAAWRPCALSVRRPPAASGSSPRPTLWARAGCGPCASNMR